MVITTRPGSHAVPTHGHTATMAVVLPANLALNVKRLANLTRTNIRLRPQSNDTVASGQTVVFRLPTNTMIDLHNLQFFANAHITGTAPMGLPTDMHGAIERVDVVVNGQTINGSNPDYGGYHQLCKHWTDVKSHKDAADWMSSGDNKVKAIEGTTAVGHREVLKRAATDTGDFKQEKIPSTADKMLPSQFPFAITGFKGFLSGDYVRFIDTAVLGPVEVRLRLAPNSILYRGTAPVKNGKTTEATAYDTKTQNADFEFNNMYMFLDTISFVDDFYRAILARRLIEGGIITIPYKNIFGFNKALASSSDTISFNLATQSMDRMWATLRDIRYSQRRVKQYSNNAEETNYYKFESGDNAGLFFDGSTTYQFQVENLHMPSWPASVEEAYVLTRAALDAYSKRDASAHIPELDQYKNGKFAFIQAFNHQANGERIISGLDTRGASSNMSFDVYNSDAGLVFVDNADGTPSATELKKYQVMIYVETTSTLEISAGQNITTIF